MVMQNKDHLNIKEVLEYLGYKNISFSGEQIKCINLMGEDREFSHTKDGEIIIIQYVGFMDKLRNDKYCQMINLEVTSDDGVHVHIFDIGNRECINKLHKLNEELEIEESDIYISETKK